jgi:hypothetical protein
VTNADVEYALAAGSVNAKFPVIYVAWAGLTPISPTIAVVPVLEIPVFARITKLPAVPRFTAAGPAANVVIDPLKPNINTKANTTIETLFNIFI